MILKLTTVLRRGAVPTDGSDPLEPIPIPISWPQGEDGTISLSVVNEVGAAVNLAGATGTLVGRATDDGPTLFSASGAGAMDGSLPLLVSGAALASVAGGLYVYDVWLGSGLGNERLLPIGVWSMADALALGGSSPTVYPLPPAAVDTIAALAATTASRVGDGFAIWVRGLDGGPRGYYHVEVGRGYAVDGVNVIAALNLAGGQWVRGLT